MLKFLRDGTIFEEIKDSIKKSDRVDIAVAFWGWGAKEQLGITRAKKTRIVCDLLSGGCNPHEIRKLLTPELSKNVEVRYLDRLHAKVYLTPDSVIAGSANASTNGLGREGLLGTIEAAVLTNDRSAIDDAQAWFEDQWKLSKRVTEPVIDQAIEAWTRIRPAPDPKDTFLNVYLTNPSWFRRRVWLTSFYSDASTAAKRKFDQVKAKYYSPHQIENFDSENMPLIDVDVADTKEVKPGDAVIDPTDATYEVVEIVKYRSDACIVLLKQKATVCGLRFPREQRVLLKKALANRLTRLEREAGRKLTNREKDFATNLEDIRKDHGEIHRFLAENFQSHGDDDHDQMVVRSLPEKSVD